MALLPILAIAVLGFSPDAFSEPSSSSAYLEKVLEYGFSDGARIKVHFTDQILEESGEGAHFPRQVLDAAVLAYQTITQFQGFSTPGFSFVDPDRGYAYDPDRTIDIYLGNPSETNVYANHGFPSRSFKDAPCFDTVELGQNQFQAVILLPANYREFIKHWETMNPSSLGQRNIGVDLKGTLIHEMLHVVLFYYNKNLNKDMGPAKSKKVDWYVEGLARYFETFAGARHDFFSQGFKQTLPDKIRFSRGGSNYFMRYPDQAFTDLRYENAVFWRFLDHRYGMPAVERFGRLLRGRQSEDFKPLLEEVTGVSFHELLKQFALAILFKDLGLKEDGTYLKEVARTRLTYRDGRMHLVDGYGRKKYLGKKCATDWVGLWEDARARFGDPAVAGDGTEEADVSGWATDFYEIKIWEGAPRLPEIAVRRLDDPGRLLVQVVMATRGGSVCFKEMPGAAELDLQKMCSAEHLEAADIQTVYLLVTNPDPDQTQRYEILIS